MSTDFKSFNDCVHGYIRVHPVCVKIIDTPEFQRLRNLKQLGSVYFVYPGASHNRFEHSLGVCHLAGKMVEALRRNCNDQSIISDEEKLCLEIAALCHDLGHGPFSHTWERFVEATRSENDKTAKWRHEESSVQMFEYLLEKNGLTEEVKKSFPIMKDTATAFIKELIKGEGKMMKERKYLYQIIANKENGIDVDKWDYMLRDCRQLNHGVSFEYSRLLEFCSVKNVGGKKIICFRNKERHNIFDMFQVRINLHNKACYHSVVRVVEEMMIDAFIDADKKGYKIHMPNDREYKLSEAHSNAAALSRMTDHIFYDILYSTKPEFEEARKLLQRILQRDLYKIVACRNLSTELRDKKMGLNGENADSEVSNEIKKYEKDIDKDIKKITKDMEHCKFERFKVRKTLLDMGVDIKGTSESTTGKNTPFQNIYFYDKNTSKAAKKKEWKDIPVLPIPEESMCSIHFLVIYKDEGSAFSENEALKKELKDIEAKLNEHWQSALPRNQN